MRTTTKKYWYKKSLKVNPYPNTLNIIFSNDIDRVSKFVSEDMKSLLAVTSDLGSTISIIFNFSNAAPITHGVITHEAYHAGAFILDYVGEEYNWRSESAAYLMDWIVDEVYKFARLKKLKIVCKNG